MIKHTKIDLDIDVKVYVREKKDISMLYLFIRMQPEQDEKSGFLQSSLSAATK